MKKALIILAIAMVWLKPAFGETVAIAAAADLAYCIEDLNNAYHQNHPDTELKVSTGSSGNFYTQIEHGAPYDVFLSADISFPRKLIDEGFAVGSTLSVYSVGRLALWTTKPATISLRNVGRYIQVDPKLYPPLQQALVLTKTGSGNSAAHDYLQFIEGQEARKIFDRYGFEAPTSPAK